MGQPVCLAFPQKAASHIGASYRGPKKHAQALRGEGREREEVKKTNTCLRSWLWIMLDFGYCCTIPFYYMDLMFINLAIIPISNNDVVLKVRKVSCDDIGTYLSKDV